MAGEKTIRPRRWKSFGKRAFKTLVRTSSDGFATLTTHSKSRDLLCVIGLANSYRVNWTDTCFTSGLNVLLVNAADQGGGAEKIAMETLKQLGVEGHQAWLAVGRRLTTHERVLLLRNDSARSGWAGLCSRLADALCSA